MVGLNRGYMNTQKINLNNLLEKFDNIIIPEIQRDYVMGSGGVDKVGNDKLKSLLKAMEGNDNSFYFSCIMGHSEGIENKNDKKVFYVYDGQQRIVTLIYLAAYLSRVENEKKYKEKIAKFSFLDRNSANEHLNEILFGSMLKSNIRIEDFTTFSIDNLYREFFDKNDNSKYKKINLDFIMNKIEFDLIDVKLATDAEQFFMDLNDGLMLEEYEIYKAELNDKIYRLFNGDENFKKWALKIDNEWLEFFLAYKTNTCCEEEAEINFIKFCFRMIYIERHGNEKEYKKRGLEWINKEDVCRVYNIINNLMEIDFQNEIENEEDYLNFAWKPWVHEQIEEKKPGGYWNLKNENYCGMLKKFLSNVCSFEVIKDDVLIWCFLSNQNIEKSKQFEYLRFIKKVLNTNRVVNNKAYYNRDIYYCRYGVYGIQNYYGNLFKGKSEEENIQYFLDTITLNKCYKENKYDDLGMFINDICNRYSEKRISNVLNKEYLKYTSEEYSEIAKIEECNKLNGLMDTLLDSSGKLIEKSSYLMTFLKETSLDDLYKGLSSIVEDFHDFMIPNIEINWVYTTGSKTNHGETGGIPFQCRADFYTHSTVKWKNMIQKLIKKDKQTNNKNYDVVDYLRYYDTIPKGWYYKSGYALYQIRWIKGASTYYYKGRYEDEFESIISASEWIQKKQESYSRDLMIAYKNTKYEFCYGYNNQKKEVFVRNINTGIEVAGNMINLNDDLLDVVGSDLRIKDSECDREFGCFDAIYCDGQFVEWAAQKKIEEYENEVYNLIHRIIRFTHRDLDESERFHCSKTWIDNPRT